MEWTLKYIFLIFASTC